MSTCSVPHNSWPALVEKGQWRDPYASAPGLCHLFFSSPFELRQVTQCSSSRGPRCPNSMFFPSCVLTQVDVFLTLATQLGSLLWKV